MTSERTYNFNGDSSSDRLLVLPSLGLVHYIDNRVTQRIAKNVDEESGMVSWGYDKFQGDLWVSLSLVNSFPVAEISRFYLGRSTKGGLLHAVAFDQTSKHGAHIIFNTSLGIAMRELTQEKPFDWEKLRKPLVGDKPEARLCDDPQTELLSFAYRLIPNKNGPIAQVSKTARFNPSLTINLDTSAVLDQKSFIRLISVADNLLLDDKETTRTAQAFCSLMKTTFSEFFVNS